MSLSFFSDEIFLKHQAKSSHPENPERLAEILRQVKAASFYDKLIIPKKWSPASEEQIMQTHSKELVEKLKTNQEKNLDPDTYINKDSFKIASYAAGAVLEAVRSCKAKKIKRAFCAIRPPGHHAESQKSMGFCLINNVAIAAHYAKSLAYKKILIIDFDVHHGNGTQEIFYEDESVFYLSSHQYPFYPGTGSFDEKGRGKGLGYTLNWPFTAGTKDSVLIKHYERHFPPIISFFKPDLVLISAGYDLHQADPLGGFNISTMGIQKILEICLKNLSEIPTIAVLEGGYNPQALAECVLMTLDCMLSHA